MVYASADDLDSRIPSSASQWYEWLVREEQKTVAAYRNKPALLIADYRRDREIARDYEGREILELLQNANDQAAELGVQGTVLFELTPEALIVANTGLAFSVGGVASLETSYFSPKSRNRRQLIGNKGLGFRSVLNWSKTPIILSSALSIAYSVEHAKRKLTALCDASPELARLVQRERHGGDELILPLLPFPLYSVDGNLSPLLSHEQARRIFERCEELLIDGYDTVIGMPFEASSAYGAAGKQLDEARAEILLFAQHLRELRFRRDGGDPVIWQRTGSDELPEVLEDGETIGSWRIHRTTGELPASAVESDDNRESTSYEIVVAVPFEGLRTASPLFSYFPTNIMLPLPLVCHATLELEQNRKHAQEGRSGNSYVLGRLAEYLCEIAEEVSAQTTGDPWAGCSMLMPFGDYPHDLTREHFPERLIEFAQGRSIVPTLSGKPTTPQFARLVSGADASWLPPELFPNVVPIRERTDEEFLDLLGVLPLELAEIKNQIVTHQDLDLDQRVALIGGLVDQGDLQEVYTSALFLDTFGRSVADGMRVFLPPSGEVPRLPEWADLRFLDEEMREKLKQRIGTNESRELQQKLSGFGLLEYSLANVIRALVAAANRAEKANPTNGALYQADLFQTVFDLHVAEEPGSQRPDYPERSPLYLRNQRKEMVAANSLYLGRGFGAQGNITQAIFEPWAPEKLVDPEIVSGLTNSQEKLRDFFQWIGVSQWPRDTEEEHPDTAYLQHVLRKIKFPAMFEEKLVASVDAAYSPRLSNVQSVEGLDEIFQQADPSAIAVWLANDDRALDWGRYELEHATLNAYPGGVIKARMYRGAVPSYVRWRLETSPWLRSADGNALRPKDCVLGERAVEELFPRPAMPDASRLEKYGAQQQDVLEGWRRAGVLTSLAYLDRDEIYAKLLELPQRSPDGRLARPLYHWLLDASDFAGAGDGPNQKEFLSQGEMWGRYGKVEAYFPIAELHHADVEGLPDVLLQKLKIVDLRKRIGPGKVEKVFGVKPIDRAGILQRPIDKDVAMGSSEANRRFQAAKPYLHKLRTSQTSQLTQLQTLKDLQLEVCSTLRAEITFEEESIEYDVPVWGWLIEQETLQVRSDPSRPMSFSESLLADSIGEALATMFRIADGGDFARMLVCKEEDRPELLRRLRGDSALQDMESIKAEFEAFSRTTIEARFPVAEPPVKLVPQIEELDRTQSEISNIESSPETTTPEPVGPLVVIAGEHVPKLPPAPRKLQVKTVTTSGVRSVTYRRVTDGEFCERKAMEFEQADNPPRWPLPVGQIMGSEGPGCDVLSFASEADREAFRMESTHDYRTVVRFIEVKGSGHTTATIELKGNELTAAEIHGDRYYLYRLFEAIDRTFQLMVLRNPLSHKEALQPAVHVGIERAAAAQSFVLIGGLKNNAET